MFTDKENTLTIQFPCNVGDWIYTRENWNIFAFSRDGEVWWPFDEIPKDDPREDEYYEYGHFEIDYQATTKSPDDKWRPSIHMPKWAARIWDEVVSVRVERLQDITKEDAISEGIDSFDQQTAGGDDYQDYYRDYSKPFNDELFPWIAGDPIASFRTLWESINGPGSWEVNPFVWRIEYKNLSTTGRPTI